MQLFTTILITAIAAATLVSSQPDYIIGQYYTDSICGQDKAHPINQKDVNLGKVYLKGKGAKSVRMIASTTIYNNDGCSSRKYSLAANQCGTYGGELVACIAL